MHATYQELAGVRQLVMWVAALTTPLADLTSTRASLVAPIWRFTVCF